jgi:hypothetical protein
MGGSPVSVVATSPDVLGSAPPSAPMACGQSASARLTSAMSKSSGSAGSSSSQYSTGLFPLKDRQWGTASPGARRDEPVRVISWTQLAPKSYSYRAGLRALDGKASRRRTASSLAVSSKSKNGSL